MESKNAMKIKTFLNNSEFIAGMTMRDENEAESGNMALHACLNTEDIVKNRMRLADFLNCRLDDFVCSCQSHNPNHYKVTLADKGRGSDTMSTAIPDNDALYTYEPDIVLCCFTADCVPVVFYNEETGLIGVIHSGWKGTVQEITPKTFRHLMESEECNPVNVNVYIGAALSREKFEVDQDVYEKFKALGYADDFISRNDKTGKYHIDNQLVVKKQCELSGVAADRIATDRTCTYASSGGFSYRQDKSCGRHLAFIMKKGGR